MPLASSRVPGLRFWVTSLRVNPHPRDFCSSSCKMPPLPNLLGLLEAVLWHAVSPTPVSQAADLTVLVLPCLGSPSGWTRLVQPPARSHQPGAPCNASWASWFSFVADLAHESPPALYSVGALCHPQKAPADTLPDGDAHARWGQQQRPAGGSWACLGDGFGGESSHHLQQRVKGKMQSRSLILWCPPLRASPAPGAQGFT